MFRLILTRHEQDGCESDRTVYATVDVSSAEVEAFLSEGWRVLGGEMRVPNGSPAPEAAKNGGNDGR